MTIEEKRLRNRARWAARHALKRGRIAKGPCAICGEAKVDMHHENYAKPLDVVMLCKRHHAEADRKRNGPSAKERIVLSLLSGESSRTPADLAEASSELNRHNVYKTISRMEERGLVRSELGPPSPHGGPARRYYSLVGQALALTSKNTTPALDRADESIASPLDAQQFLRNAPVGLCYLDKDLRYLQINEWLARINGISVDEHLGRTIADVLPEVSAGVEVQLRHVLETGEPIVDGLVTATTPAHPTTLRTYQHNYFPDRSADGDVIGIFCAVDRLKSFPGGRSMAISS